MHPLRQMRPEGAATGHTPAVRIAQSDQEILHALNLVYRAYLRSGFIRPHVDQLRVTPYHLLPATQVLIALLDDEVISTATLIPDSSLGLPMEELYATEVDVRRRFGKRLAEVSCLADRRKETDVKAPPETGERRKRSGEGGDFGVLMQLMSLTAQVASHQEIDEVLIAVHPRHAAFYRRFFGFEVIGDLKSYEAVNGNPAVPLVLNFDQMADRCPRGYERLFGTRFSEVELTARPWSAGLQRQLTASLDRTYPSKATRFEPLAVEMVG